MATDEPPAPLREMKVLCLGLPRTGSTSMAEALTVLGYKDVYHTSQTVARPGDWVHLERAADATFPCLPSYAPEPPFGRADWDRLWGRSEATTDAASIFAPQLIAAYPDARVVLVERDYDRWHASMFGSLFPVVWGPMSNLTARWVEPLVGFRGGAATRKMLLGLFDAHDPDEAQRNAPRVHEEHSRRIKELVPEDRLLVYRMGQGWEPLCNFLGCDVPDSEFPWLNEAAMLRRIALQITVDNTLKAAAVVAPWVAGIGSLAAAAYIMAKRR